MQKLAATFVLFLLSTSVGQDVQHSDDSSVHDLSAMGTAFDNFAKDFRAMGQPLSPGNELAALQFLEQVAMTSEDRLFAANAELQIYDSVSCGADRLKVKRILKEQLATYSWLFDKEITRTTGGLNFVKAPAAAQMAVSMKDEMRAAKEKLDAIGSAL